MELLNEKVINSKDFQVLKSIIKNRYIKNPNFKIYYSEFQETVIAVVEEIMRTYLEDTKYSEDKCSCVIKRCKGFVGDFNPKNNRITINEQNIDNIIYLGNINSMDAIFHELNHFKLKYDMRLGKINKDVIRNIKESLIRSSTAQNPFNDKNIKEGITVIDDAYYNCNYDLYSGEKIAQINAINNLISFVEIAGIELSEQHLHELQKSLKDNIEQYNNYLRDLRFNYEFNDYFLDFEEAFDVMIKFNPGWLAFSQLNIEYYLDEDGNVAKRTKEELAERLKTETDEDIKEYLQYLLTNNLDKELNTNAFSSDNMGFKIDKMKYTNIKNDKKSGFKK